MFCKECGGLLKKKKKGKKEVLVCNSCGIEYERSKVKTEIKEKGKDKKDIEVVEKEETGKEVVKEKCPKCGHGKAYFWTVQTRAADEPETRFYKCAKCSHTWREYD